MLKNISMMFMSAMILMGSMGTARALLSAPDVVYKGKAINAEQGNPVSIAVILNRVAVTVASGSVAADRSFELRVPMDSVDPRASGTACSGDSAEISVNGAVVRSVTIPAFGTVVLLELGDRTAEQWAKDHPGDDGSGDMNRNGISDLNEYLAGNDPAACVWNQVDASHAESAVYHREVLKNCLAEAGRDGKHNLIRLARGDYAGNFSYTSSWGESFDLILVGGYDPDYTKGITERSADPELTILNGDTDNDSIGNGSVLVVDGDISKTGGKVHIESLTFKNGKAPAGQYGGGIRARIYQGSLELVGNIVSGNATDSVIGNTADGGGGVSLESSDSGSIFLANNVIYGNSAANAAAARIVSSAAGPVFLLNNTIADNVATVDGDGSMLNISSSLASVDLSNNIVSAAHSGEGKDIYINSSGISIPLGIRNNDYDALHGLLVNAPGFVPDPGNLHDAPQFVAPLSGNYRLAPASTLIDKGLAHANLPETDVVGAGRIADGVVDLGAYEYHDPTKPFISSFTAVPRPNYLIADTVIIASDDLGITGYCLTESADSADSAGCSWSSSAPASYTFASAGSKTLYAHVVDASGNVVSARVLNIMVTIPNLTVAVNVSGPQNTGIGGTITSSPAGISCSNGASGTVITCTASFSGTVNLFATPSVMSTFGGWGGGIATCSGLGACSVAMNGEKTVTASFIPAALLRIDGTIYKTLQEVYDAAYDGAVIQLLDNAVAGTLDANRNIGVKLKGGYDAGYSTTPGTTMVTGPLTVGRGELVVDRIVIR
ncbi:MAG: choice-of-anchor Q domain-containing protein [Geobacteraceae bacterium]|nr:choice-of-anchor Q domain-containing protein [Geobacteraceae bacterium]